MTLPYRPARKYGRRPPHPESTHPRIHARRILKTGYTGTVPSVVDWFTGITFPMYLNDSLGDCTIADEAHAVQTFTFFGQEAISTVSDQDVLTVYERVGGYVPGRPQTDQGCVIQDVLNDWRKTGIGNPAHKILAFFQVDYTNAAELKACCWLFGGVTLGVNLPFSAEDQFDAHQVWDYDPRANNKIAGGHDVRLLGVDSTGMMTVSTWGATQRVTPAWLARYCEEAWAEADSEWIKDNASPEGLDVAALNAAFQQVTGQPGPFPAVIPPTPTPTPPGPTPAPPGPSPTPPAPTPGPCVDAADRALATVLRPLATQQPRWWSRTDPTLIQAARTWLAAKGL